MNLVHPLHILMLFELFEGRSWRLYNSKKTCSIKMAKYQGKEELDKHHSNSNNVRQLT